jgi:predicted nuclease of restriction endonuclease-like RecB superfamily
LLALAEGLIKLFREADGKTIAEVEAELDGCEWATHPIRPAVAKLLLDRCEEVDDDGQIAETRWQQLKTAEELRTREDFPTFVAFQYALAKRLGGDIAAMREALYADLPEFRRLKGFEPLAPAALLHRLNCAQIQGLLLHALDVKVTIVAALPERRRFFRCLKFQRLLSEVKETDGGITLSLSGPMRIFQNTQSYGLRLANFFPYILQMPRWELEAELKLGTKRLTLQLTDKVRIKSHYREMTPFVPPELTAFIDTFNGRGSGWVAALGADYLHVGRQSHCFPDVSLRGCMGEVVHMELFHRWHSGQLARRLEALEANPGLPILVGVAEDLRGDKAIDAALGRSAWFNRNGFTFKNFPTPKAVLAALTRRGAPAKSSADEGGTANLAGFWEPTAGEPSAASSEV